ncbi:MAG: hypothetical protein ABIR17_08930 [Pseudolysinimonas sp.]|uniref:hypothetical protein n=1 Tax=Pseudolysinimonas sp. TaxID=2680009 RepID=UPI003265260E
MTMDAASPVATPGPMPLPARRPRNKIGIVAMVIVLFLVVAPIVGWIVLAIAGAGSAESRDNAIMIVLFGGLIVILEVISITSPLAVGALILGIVSMFAPGSKAPGIFAIVIGAIYSLGLFGLPTVLAEILPKS